jgi:hypothetical protein
VSVPGPVLGPCSSWIDGDYLAACCPQLAGSDVSAELIDTMAFEASMALYELSGRRFTGLCTRTVRPCRTGSTCWDIVSANSDSRWFWVYGGYGVGWGWRDEGVPFCGCRGLSEIRLAGYPVRDIVEVKIDGVVLDPLDANGNRNYRIDDWQTLVRMDDPGPPAVTRRWPSCQHLALDDTEAGTFSVTYRHGVDPPELGRKAAAELACQLMLSCPGSLEDCELPQGVTRVERQGIVIDRELLAGFFDPTKPTGLVSLDLFMVSYGRNPGKRAPAVWSPDVAPFAKRVG